MNKKISSAFGISIVLIIASLIGIIIYLEVNTNTKNIVLEEDDVPQEDDGVSEGASDWKIYNNDELGISFSYPLQWGVVEEETFDNSGKVRYYEFSNLEHSQLGTLRKDYFDNHPGRGGSLIDASGFIEGSLLKSYGDGKLLWDEGNYQVSSSGFCAYSTYKHWFDEYVYHAVCNLENDEFSGFNLSFGTNYKSPEIEISEENFIKLVESVKIVH